MDGCVCLRKILISSSRYCNTLMVKLINGGLLLIKQHEQKQLGKNLKLSFHNPNRWIKETKLDEQPGKEHEENMQKIKDELVEGKGEFNRELAKKDDKISKLQNLNQIFVKEVEKLREGNVNKLHKDDYESKEKFARRDNEVNKLQNHNQSLDES